MKRKSKADKMIEEYLANTAERVLLEKVVESQKKLRIVRKRVLKSVSTLHELEYKPSAGLIEEVVDVEATSLGEAVTPELEES